MAKDLQFRRQILKRSTVPGEVPTIPSSNDHTDGSWLVTDIYEGELFYNIPDNILYVRSGSNIVNLSGGQTTEEIIATVSGLGITLGETFPVGTSYQDLFKAILAPYIPPSFGPLTITLSVADAYIEVGRQIDVVSAAWGVVNDSEGNPPQDMNLSGDGFNIAVTGVNQNSVPPLAPTQLLIVGAKTWTLVGEDGNATPISSVSYSKNWRFRMALGAVALADPISDMTASALVTALQQFQLLVSKAATFTCTVDNDTVGNYTWIAYPASWGALSNIIQNGALPVLSAFTYIGAFNVTNAYSVIESYRFYKSNADKAFANGTTLAIS